MTSRRALRARLIERVGLSIQRPADAKYVVNRLTVHELDLLAEAAVVFARAEVEALLAAEPQPQEAP